MDSTGKHLFLKKSHGWKLVIDKAESSEYLIKQIEYFIVSGTPPRGWVQLESSDNANVWKFNANSTWYIFKEYLKRNNFDIIKTIMNGSRAQRAFRNAKKLLEHGFFTPEVLALGEKTSFYLTSCSFLVTEHVADASGMYTLLKDSYIPPLPPEKIRHKRSLLISLGKYIGALHAKGFFHGDLRLDNIMVTGFEKKSPQFYLIDNERNRFFPKGIPSYLRRKNLVQLNMIMIPQLTFADRMRFFKSYLGENPELQPFAKSWMRTVFLLTEKRLQRKHPEIGKRH